MLVKYASAKIVEKIADPNLIAASQRFPNFSKRVAAVQPIKLYPDKFLYIRNRSISAMETYGANENGDAFPREELMNRYATFIGTPVTIDHTENRVIGMVLDSAWIPKMIFRKGALIPFNYNDIQPGDQIVGDWIENILAIDKVKANVEHPHLIEQIQDGEVTDTSMGCFVNYSICSVPTCRKKASSPEEYCRHVANFKNKVYSGVDVNNQRVHVYEENHGITFFEDSVIIPTRLGGVAGGEGADPGAKLLEKIASQPFDLTPYMVTRKADQQVTNKAFEVSEASKTSTKRTADQQFVGYGDDFVEMGEKPEAVEQGEQQYDDVKERENEVQKAERLRQRVEEYVEEVEEKIQDLKSLVTQPISPSSEIDMTQGSKEKVLVEIRSNNQADFDYTLKLLQNIPHELVYSNNNQKRSSDLYYARVEISPKDTYKVNELRSSLEEENKDVVLHTISSRRLSMQKGQLVTFKTVVSKIADGILTLSIDKLEMPVTSKVLASIKSSDVKVDLGAKSRVSLSSLLVKAEDAPDTIKEGDEVEVPGIVSEEPDDSGTVVIDLDVDAQTEIDDELVPVEQLIIPEDDVEVEEEVGEEEEEVFEPTGEFTGEELEASKKEAQGGPKPPNPKAKVPGAGGSNAPTNKASNPELSTLQRRYTPKPKDKVPDAGKHATKQAEKLTVRELIAQVRAAKEAAKKASKRKALTTWVDLIMPEPQPGWKVKNKKTGEEYTVVGSNDKFVQVEGHPDIPAGDGFGWGDWELYDAEGNKVPSYAKGSKKQAELPEEFSIDEAPGVIPKDKSTSPEQAAETDYVGGGTDTSKEPENTVTQLSSKHVAALIKRNRILKVQATALKKELSDLQQELSMLTELNASLKQRVKPLEIREVISSMLQAGTLENTRASVEAQYQELSQLYDKNYTEFAALRKLSAKFAVTSNRSKSPRRLMRTAAQELANPNEMEIDETRDVPPQTDNPNEGYLEQGILFEE